MEFVIFNETNDFYNFFFFLKNDNNDNCFMTMIKNIDSLKNGLKDSFSISKCKKIFNSLILYDDTRKLTNFELKGNVFDLISALTYLYEMHPVLNILIIFFYMTKYKCCDKEDDLKIFFESSLRSYMGFFLDPKIVNVIFERRPCTSCLITFVLEGLIVLNEAANFSRKFLIHYFYRHHFGTRSLIKEYSETQTVFDLTDFKNKTTVNICAGNACGIHFLDSKITCIDKNKYIGMELLDKMDICHFVQCDIMENSFTSIASIFKLWIAIHACSELSIRIIEVFLEHASEDSELYLVPCCSVSKKRYKVLLDQVIYNRLYNAYYLSKTKRDNSRQHFCPAMHMELLCSLCMNNKFKIKTLRSMKSVKNKVIILYK